MGGGGGCHSASASPYVGQNYNYQLRVICCNMPPMNASLVGLSGTVQLVQNMSLYRMAKIIQQ